MTAAENGSAVARRADEHGAPPDPNAGGPRSRWLGFTALSGIFLILLLGLVAAIAPTMPWASANACPTSATTCRRVLFIGNSYSSANDLPGMIRRLARSAGETMATGIVAPDGETLAGQAAPGSDATTAITGSPWSVVVLQEQSEIPAAASSRAQMVAPALTLIGLARSTGAEAVLFETWAHRDGWPEMRMDFGAMQAALDTGYEQLAAATGIRVAPVGRAWSAARSTYPEIDLWADDGSHPSASGTYLAACVLYGLLLGADPAALHDDGDLPPETARALREVASATIR